MGEHADKGSIIIFVDKQVRTLVCQLPGVGTRLKFFIIYTQQIGSLAPNAFFGQSYVLDVNTKSIGCSRINPGAGFPLIFTVAFDRLFKGYDLPSGLKIWPC